jgi:hypothetical protein
MVIDFVKENSVSIIIVVCVIIGLLVLFSLLGINFEDSNKKKISKIITIETIDNFNTPMNDSFCNTYKSNPSKLNKKCKELTNNNCMNINCCILANGKKCMAGNKGGPIFYSDEMNNKINIDYYYYKQKCIGKC